MISANEPLSTSIIVIMYFGDVVFAVSGALQAAKHKMDIIGFLLIGTITGIGGGTLRDLLLGRPVWWIRDPFELILCVAASFGTFFFVKNDITKRNGMVWSDTLGLASFCVVGCHIALAFGAPFIVAIFLGMMTATGGGVIRDLLTQTKPMILSGQLYATAALVGSLVYAFLARLNLPVMVPELAGFLAAFSLRAAAVIFNIRMGPPGEFIRLGNRGGLTNHDE